MLTGHVEKAKIRFFPLANGTVSRLDGSLTGLDLCMPSSVGLQTLNSYILD